MRVMAFLLAGLVLSGAAWGQVPGGALFGGFRVNPEAGLEIESDTLELKEVDSSAVFSGSVSIAQDGFTMMADKVEVHYDPVAGNSSARTVKTINAIGSVTITGGGDRVSGDSAVYEITSETIEIAGTVILERDGDRVAGDLLRVDLKEGVSSMSATGSKRVRVVFSPQPGGAKNE